MNITHIHTSLHTAVINKTIRTKKKKCQSCLQKPLLQNTERIIEENQIQSHMQVN